LWPPTPCPGHAQDGGDDAAGLTALREAVASHWDYGYDALGQLTSAKGFESGGGSRAQEQLT
jgi:YD repeat-containing protein